MKICRTFILKFCLISNTMQFKIKNVLLRLCFFSRSPKHSRNFHQNLVCILLNFWRKLWDKHHRMISDCDQLLVYLRLYYSEEFFVPFLPISLEWIDYDFFMNTQGIWLNSMLHECLEVLKQLNVQKIITWTSKLCFF